MVALVEAMCAPGALAAPPAALPRRERLRALLLGFVEGVTSYDSLSLYRALVAEAERMPELGRLFWDAGPRQLRTALARVWAPAGGPGSRGGRRGANSFNSHWATRTRS